MSKAEVQQLSKLELPDQAAVLCSRLGRMGVATGIIYVNA